MSRTALSLPDEAKTLPLCFGLVDDFFALNSSIWTDVEGDAAGNVAIDADGTGGVVACTVTTTNNEEAYTAANECFKIAAGKPIELTARIQFAEAATDDANVIVGLMDAWGANQLVDDGAGPKTTWDGACFYKVDGGTRWRVRTSNGTAYTDTELENTAGQAGYQTLRILIQPGHDGYAEVSYWIDQAGGNALTQCREYLNTAREPAVKHRVLLASMTEVAVGFGLKNGGANSETLNVDYLSCYQLR